MQGILTSISQAGFDKLLYDAFFVAGFVAVFLFIVWSGKYYGVDKTKAVLLVLIVYPTVVLWMFIQFWIETGTFGGNNIVRCFVYMPLFAFPAAKLLELKWKQACDLLAPAPCVVHAVSHWGCVFSGCCHGYPSSWGLYNVDIGYVCFPSQPLEALTALGIVYYLVWRAKKNNYKVDGLAMPSMLMMFGFTRFLWEFFRDNEKLWMGCSSLAFHALFMGVIGLIMYIVIKKDNNKPRIPKNR